MKPIWLMSAALFACASNEPPVMYATVTSAGMFVDVDPAAEHIATERCNRQLSCGNIGKSRRWTEWRACEIDMGKTTHDVIGRSCSEIDAMRLRACVDEVRDQLCEESGNFPLSCEGVRLCR